MDGLPPEEMPSRDTARRHFADLVRLTLTDRDFLSVAEERALLTRAVADLALPLPDASAILAAAAGEHDVMLERAERAQLGRMIKGSAPGGRLAGRDLRTLSQAATPYAERRGVLPPRAEVLALAEEGGVQPALWLRHWFMTLPHYRAVAAGGPAPWLAAVR